MRVAVSYIPAAAVAVSSRQAQATTAAKLRCCQQQTNARPSIVALTVAVLQTNARPSIVALLLLLVMLCRPAWNVSPRRRHKQCCRCLQALRLSGHAAAAALQALLSVVSAGFALVKACSCSGNYCQVHKCVQQDRLFVYRTQLASC
jgi:hypothetical protein